MIHNKSSALIATTPCKESNTKGKSMALVLGLVQHGMRIFNSRIVNKVKLIKYIKYFNSSSIAFVESRDVSVLKAG